MPSFLLGLPTAVLIIASNWKKKAKHSPMSRINKFWNVHNRIFGNENNYQHIEQPGNFQQAKEIKQQIEYYRHHCLDFRK